MRTALLILAIIAVALNQRPAVVAIAPLADQVRNDTGLSSALVGLLTALPVLCFGAFAPVAPRLALRIGLERAIAVSLVLLATGIGLRLLTPLALLYAGTLLAGGAIALANVIIPAYVKREFHRPGVVMGVYTASLNVGAAAAAAITVPLAGALGLDWRGALGMWLTLALAALAFWLPATARSGRTSPTPGAPTGSWSLLHVPLARQVTVYFGLQSALFYSFAAWLPTLLVDAGLTVREGGLLLGLNNLVGAAGALVAPALAGRMRTQRPLLLAVIGAYLIGLGGLLLTPDRGTVVWVSVFGIAQGAGFALALTFTVLRSATPSIAARLGGVAQCLGYLLAACGPLALGALNDLTGGWSWPLALLLVLLVPLTWAGWGAARNAVLDDEEPGFSKPPAPEAIAASGSADDRSTVDPDSAER